MIYCKYGCGKEAKYIFKNGTQCCSDSSNKCSENRKKNSIGVKENRRIEKEKGIIRIRDSKKLSCQYCSKQITEFYIEKHELFCYLNQKNIRACPICKTPIKNKKATTCSQKCSQIYFRDMFDEIRKTRDMSWADGHSYTFICFEHHERKCVICGEDVIVSVHHYDGDHTNDDPTNFVPLCPTHHMYMHSKHIYLIKECVDEYVDKFKKMFQGGSMV